MIPSLERRAAIYSACFQRDSSSEYGNADNQTLIWNFYCELEFIRNMSPLFFLIMVLQMSSRESKKAIFKKY